MIALWEEHQKTIHKTISFSGIGLFTGKKVQVSLIPAEENSGIVFRRKEASHNIEIPATVDYVAELPRCTRLFKDGIYIQTIEHLLSACHAFSIDNLCIEIEGPELPAGDGSAALFVQLLEEAGICLQSEKRLVAKIQEPIFWSEADTHLIALPSDITRISYTLHYPDSTLLQAQYHSLTLTKEYYKKEIAPCRTFSLYEDIEFMLQQGLLTGASLENGVVIKGNKIANPEGLRFEDEMVRHKILDLIGDLFLIGTPILAHIIAIRSGHSSNVAFSKKIKSYIQREL